MEKYKYHIHVNSNVVTAEIYYEVKPKSILLEGELMEIRSCYKTFGGNRFKDYPNEKQLIDAKAWAITQCEIMNKHH